MGLFDSLTPQQNARINAGLLGMGAGLLQGSTGNYGQFGPALGQGFAGFGQGMQQAQQMQQMETMHALQAQQIQQKMRQQQQYQDFFSGQQPTGATTDALQARIQQAVNSGNPELVDWGFRQMQFANQAQQADMRGQQMSLDEWSAPVQTSQGFGQVNRKTGQFRPIQGADGQTLMPTTIDPNAQGAVAQAKAYGTQTGKGQAEREASAPADLAQIDNMERSIDNILNHPGLSWGVGWQAALPTVPGTRQADFVAASKQLEGQAFLQAFESLKGGGQITEIEGQKATQAIGRLDRAQSEEEYKRSLQELKDVLSSARRRIQRQAGGAVQPFQTDPTQPAQSGDFSSLWGG